VLVAVSKRKIVGARAALRNPGSRLPTTSIVSPRPCAAPSPLLPKLPLRFVVGPADTIRGEAAVPIATDKSVAAPWTATFIAAPLSDGVITDRWDGSLRLRIELDVDVTTILKATHKDEDETAALNAIEKSIKPLEFLAHVLFPVDEKKPEIAKASANFMIGPRLFQLKSLANARADAAAWQSVARYEHIIRSVFVSFPSLQAECQCH
jgi:hypothetical protein